VRVCVLDRVASADIVATGPISLPPALGVQASGAGTVISISATGKGRMRVRSGASLGVEVEGTFRICGADASTRFGLAGKSYADTLLVACDGASLYVVNILPLEDYLAGVLPNEIGRRRDEEIEAVKAQANLARTYAFAKILSPVKRLFDLYGDTRDQVFSGAGDDNNDPVAARALRATAGQLLTFNGALAEGYYHSTCGGSTEASSLVWERPQSKPYLTGVRDEGAGGAWCNISPAWRWSESYTRAELEALLRNYLPAATDAIPAAELADPSRHLLDIAVVGRMPSGRVESLRIVFGTPKQQRSVLLRGDRIRWVLRRGDGSGPLRSTLFDLSVVRDGARWIRSVRIDGGGNGHGIGLCQWGAVARARAGFSARGILEAYFPGTDIDRRY
jgi:stage II sporulation protein D